MIDLAHTTQNRLLNMLEATNLNAFFAQFELVYLPQDEVLFESGQQFAYSYFPISAVISTVFQSSLNCWLETEAIRNDGMFGLPSSIDNQLVTSAVVQSAGHAYRIETKILEKELKRSDELLQVLLKFLQLRITKIAQIAVCTRFHSIEQQLSRILLHVLDCSPTSTLMITQQTIAEKLNVRRESITQHSGSLLNKGIIARTRGKITILNRAALEKATCECYHLIANETDRLLKCNTKLAYNRMAITTLTSNDLEYLYH